MTSKRYQFDSMRLCNECHKYVYCNNSIGPCGMYTMTNHLESSCEGNRVPCSKCNMPLNNDHISYHLANDCMMNKVDCPHCNNQFNIALLQDHILNKCEKNMKECSYCNKQFNIGSIKYHEKACKNYKVCEYCDKRLDPHYDYNHLKYCDKNVTPCSKCNTHINPFNMDCHLKYKCEETKVHKCSFCDMLFHEGYIDEHIPMCPKNTTQCVHCNKTLVVGALNFHIKYMCNKK
jgi:hypothetical protein